MFLGLFGILRLGRLVRYVSHSVMTGFLVGVAVVLVLDQFAPLVGAVPEAGNELAQFADVIRRGEFHLPTAGIGVLALTIAAGLGRTRLASLSSLVALLIPSGLVVLLGLSAVEVVADVNPIPRGVPLPVLPDLALLSPPLALSALAVAVVIAVQGAGVSQSVDNPDGSRPDASRDMLAQGAGNLASGLLSGIPAGGSVGQTALNVSVGARARWAAFLSGAWMLLIVVAVPGLVGQVPTTVLAALMILAGLSAIDHREVRSIWNTGGTARVLIAATFFATLVLSVPVAVGVGVALSLVLFVLSSASDVRVRALQPLSAGFAEIDPPARLPCSAAITRTARSTSSLLVRRRSLSIVSSTPLR